MRPALAIVLGLAALVGAAAAIAAPAPEAQHAYQGLKRTVAVYQFQTSDAAAAAASADALTAMLTDALVRDGRFVVVERQELADIATEQQLGTQASATAETAAHAGKMIGASLIIRGSVTKYEPNVQGSSLSIGLPVGGFGGNNALGVHGGHALIGISLRVIDSTTSQVLATVKAEGTASSHGMDVSAANSSGAQLTASTLSQTPLGQAAEQAIDKAVPQIVLAADRTPWRAAVIEVDGPTVWVNAGADQNLASGTVLKVRRKTKDLTDPSTGEVLDTLMSDVGTIRIDQVRPRVSSAVVVDGEPPQRGDLLQAP